jgi:Family of unknown function (DUF6399)
MRLSYTVSSVHAGFCERVPDSNLLGEALELLNGGHSISEVSQSLGTPRTTLRDQLEAFNRIHLPFSIKKAFLSEDGDAFLKRVVVSAHLYFRDVCACGLRILGDFFKEIGIADLIGASLGCQWKLGKQVEEAIVDFGNEQLSQVAEEVRGKEITLALDENFHEGICLVGIDPISNFLVLEEVGKSRKTEDWRDALSPVIAFLGVNVVQVTSDCGTSIVALCEEIFKAHHSPDLFHVLYNFRRTFKPAIRRVKKALETGLCKQEKEIDELKKLEEKWNLMTSEEKGRGRPPDFKGRLEALELSWTQTMKEYAELESSEKALLERLKQMSKGYHPVNTEMGQRQSSQTFAILGENVLRSGAEMVEKFELQSDADDALSKLSRMFDKMAKTLDHVDHIWGQKATAWTSDHREKYVLQSKLVVAAYMERVALSKGVLEAHEINKSAKKLKQEAEQTLGKERCEELFKLAEVMAGDFQRSTSMVEGRNGVLSLRHHAFHSLSELKRQVLSTIHNYVTKRADGTTAAERFSGVKPPNLVDWLCERIKTIPKSGGKRPQNRSA